MIWSTLTEKLLGSRLNPDWTRTLNSLMRNRLNKHDAMLAKLAFQAAVYWIWRERNGRRHQRPPNSIQSMTHTIRVEIHNCLLALRRNSNDDEGEKLLLRWTEVT
uniref:Reverse transcriptase zinc-binding domain-containing protein n=1 Tax=Brassica oleracea var. oleracea TaxID=109376 RepID=A0A0D3DKZ6_BRAOL